MPTAKVLANGPAANLISGRAEKCGSCPMTRSALPVPGGTTPGANLLTVSAGPIWIGRAARLCWGTNAWVAPDHEMSNAPALRNRLLVGPCGAGPGLYAVLCGRADSAEAAETAVPQIESKLPVAVLVARNGPRICNTASLSRPSKWAGRPRWARDAPAVCPINVAGRKSWRNQPLSRRVLEARCPKHLVIFRR